MYMTLSSLCLADGSRTGTVKFEFDQASLFLDVETERDLYIDPGMARKEYLRKLEVHTAAARQCCEHLGITYHSLNTDRPLELALFDFLRSRMQRAKKVQRNVTRRSSVSQS